MTPNWIETDSNGMNHLRVRSSWVFMCFSPPFSLSLSRSLLHSFQNPMWSKDIVAANEACAPVCVYQYISCGWFIVNVCLGSDWQLSRAQKNTPYTQELAESQACKRKIRQKKNPYRIKWMNCYVRCGQNSKGKKEIFFIHFGRKWTFLAVLQNH